MNECMCCFIDVAMSIFGGVVCNVGPSTFPAYTHLDILAQNGFSLSALSPSSSLHDIGQIASPPSLSSLPLSHSLTHSEGTSNNRPRTLLTPACVCNTTYNKPTPERTNMHECVCELGTDKWCMATTTTTAASYKRRRSRAACFLHNISNISKGISLRTRQQLFTTTPSATTIMPWFYTPFPGLAMFLYLHILMLFYVISTPL